MRTWVANQGNHALIFVKSTKLILLVFLTIKNFILLPTFLQHYPTISVTTSSSLTSWLALLFNKCNTILTSQVFRTLCIMKFLIYNNSLSSPSRNMDASQHSAYFFTVDAATPVQIFCFFAFNLYLRGSSTT